MMWGLLGRAGLIKASVFIATLTFSELAICVEQQSHRVSETSNRLLADAIENTFQTRINREMEMQRIRHSLQSTTQKMKVTRARFSGPISGWSSQDVKNP